MKIKYAHLKINNQKVQLPKTLMNNKKGVRRLTGA
jgi:hypothetical protein